LPSNLLSGNLLLETFHCENCVSTHLPFSFFDANSNLRNFIYFNRNKGSITPEWLNNKELLEIFIIEGARIAELPRNSFNSRFLRQFTIVFSSLRQLDFFLFNRVEGLEVINLVNDVTSIPQMEALDFNLFDRARNLRSLSGRLVCTSLTSFDFELNRAQNMAILEPCFVAFDERVLGEF
jgi:hypothetical protein